MGSPTACSSGRFAGLDKPRGFAYHPNFVARRLYRVRSSLVATFAAIVSACSATVRGVERDAPPGAGQSTSPAAMTRPVREEGLALRSVESLGASSVASTAPAAAAVSDPSVPSPSQPYAPPPADGGSATPPSPEPPYDPREKQIELLTDAVTALRQEIGRSYEYSQRLTQENEKLRGVVAGLRRELAKEKGGSKALREQLESLENRIRELAPPPPLQPPNEAGGSASAAPVPNATNASPQRGAAADTGSGAPPPQ
jgi:hypothetical protein